MNRQSTHHIAVCLSCRPKGGAVRPGPDLVGRLRAALAEDDDLAAFDVSGAACMAGCTRPCTVAYHAPGKASYLIGGLTSEETGALVEFARVHIAAGALHNSNDLVVSPEHRLFVYQRADELGAGRSEVLIKARNLVNATTVTRTDGGFIEYYQLLFDDHQIIYAEGIAAETLLADLRTSSALPPEVAARLQSGSLRHSDRSYLDFDLPPAAKGDEDLTETLRRASTG